MTTHTYAELRIPEARRLADLTGISSDLARASDLASRILKGFETEKPEWDLIEPFSIAIVVSYSRPFATGVRHRLSEVDLAILDERERAAHERLRAYRDKHFAHSVNSYEQNVPHASYAEGRAHVEGFHAISCVSNRVAGISRAELADVVALAEKLGSHVHAMMAEEQQRLLKIVRAMPVDDLLAGGQAPFKGGDGPINKPRASPF